MGNIPINRSYAFDVSREHGAAIQRLAQSPQAAHSKTDNLVDARHLNAQDLEGAIQHAQSHPEVGVQDKIYLNTPTGTLALDIEANQAQLNTLIEDLKAGKTVTLADLDLNNLTPQREPNLTLQYNEKTLNAMRENRVNAKTAAIADNIHAAYQQFERHQLQAGQTLNDADRLNLAVKTMNATRVPAAEQKVIVSQLFYDQFKQPKPGQDYVSQVAQDPKTGDVRVDFATHADYGDLKSVSPQHFAAPQSFTGLDDNYRQLTVQNIKKGLSSSGEKLTGVPLVGEGNASVLSQRKNEIARDFLLTDKGRPFRALSPAQRQASTAYQQALADQRFSLQASYLDFGVAELSRQFADQAKDPGVSDIALAQQALASLQRFSYPDLQMRPHTDVLLEDEAVIELFMEQVRQVRVHVNADNGQVSVP